HCLVSVIERGFAEFVSIPLNAGDFAGLTSDARSCIDKLADAVIARDALSWRGSWMRRNRFDLKSLTWHRRSSGFLHFHQKTFELWCVSVRIDSCWREQVRRVERRLAFILFNPAITPVDRNADLEGLLTVDHHRLYSLCDHSLGNVLIAGAGYFDLLAPSNAHLIRKLSGNFDEGLGNELHVHRIVLGPVVVMLSQPIGSANHVEALLGRTPLVQVRLELLGHWIV